MSKDLKERLAQKLAENNKRHAAAEQEAEFDAGREHTKLSLDLIDPNPYQPRKTFPQAALEELAASIAESGLLQPISVRQVGGRYQIIAGERRFRAHKILAKHSIEAIIIPATEAEMAVFALVENIGRKDLADYEIGRAIRQIETIFPNKTKLAESLGLHREDMYRYFAFEALPSHLQGKLEANPGLLGRTAATDIKRVLQSHGNSTEILSILDDAWLILESGELEQTKVASYILKKHSELHVSTTRVPSPISLPLARAGKEIGSITRNNTSFIVKLKVSALSDEQAGKLQRFVEQLVAEKV